MVEVQNLTKIYHGTPAIDQISFQVEEGEVVGFLGPNGAGKTTTMRILAGFLSATSGKARIAGFDVESDSVEARRRIGYMPEDMPLYDEMRVVEYLEFRARLKGLQGADVKRRVGEVLERCGLSEAHRSPIRVLSKGFRQRVGLADAFVHEPSLLILDEPTNGLDPNQIRQVREMIRELGRKHTILLSTHILHEVEMTCERVIILDCGRIRASDRPEVLARDVRRGRVTAEIRGDAKEVSAALETLDGVEEVVAEPGDGTWASYRISFSAGEDVRGAVFRLVVENGWELRELSGTDVSLEDVFETLTRTEAAA